ncbi:restriction endonuclease subunit S [Algicola sagamiensis]|uniref:restriction endonuclease subunit S n=1 Tax=Algicola sagamiensis TaxID=163869 RepID=UPI00037BF1E3|nr:restriction endonuclease subunit S [Algicola sagamiensis]
MAKYSRYPSYKEVDLDYVKTIPDGWKYASLSKLFRIQAGGDVQSKFFSTVKTASHSYPIYTNANDAKAVYGYTSQSNYSRNSITVSGRGEVGFAVYRDHDFDAIIRLLVLSPIVALDCRFFAYFINEVIDFNVQSSAIGQLSTLQISPYKVLIPSREEQTQIANFLDHETAKIDTLTEKQQQLIKLLKEKRQAVISHAVTKGLNPEAPMKDSGVEWLGEVPEHWRMKPLRYLGSCQNGINIGAEFFGSGYPFVSYGDAYKNYSLPTSVAGLVRSTEKDREAYSLLRGDVLFTRTSETIEEIGLSSVCLDSIPEATFAGFLIRFRPSELTLHPEFSKFSFRNQLIRTFFVKEMNLVTRASLSQELLKKLPVPLPPLEEQIEIAEFLGAQEERFQSLFDNTEKAIQLLKERRTALISAAVTGKIDVRNWQAPTPQVQTLEQTA